MNTTSSLQDGNQLYIGRSKYSSAATCSSIIRTKSKNSIKNNPEDMPVNLHVNLTKNNHLGTSIKQHRHLLPKELSLNEPQKMS
jgi:hypothetical protein